MMLVWLFLLLLVATPAFAQSGPGLWQAAPGTGIPQCTSIGTPVTNRTWCFDGNNNPNYTVKVWDGTQYVSIIGGGGGGAPVNAHYVLTLPNVSLPNAVDLSVLPAALLINDPVFNTLVPFAGFSCPAGQLLGSISAVGGGLCFPAALGLRGKQQFCNTTTTAAINFGTPAGSGSYAVTLGTAPVSGTPPHVVADYNTPTVNGFNIVISDQPGAGNCVEVSWNVGDGSATFVPVGNVHKTCVVPIGDPGAGSPALADDNDSPVACPNNWGVDWTITSVGCWANAGSPTVTPILTGGSGTSILTGALTCGTGSWAAGTVNGTPVVHSFSGGATCSVTPCSADVNITTAGGTAKYIVVKISGTIPQ